MMFERNWSLIGALYINLLLFGSADPISELHVVFESCGEQHDRDMVRQLHNNFFPNTSSLWVIDIMGLIKDNPFYILKSVCVIVDLVLKHLCCHNNNCRISVYANISCEDSNIVAELYFKVSKFLIG